MAAPAGKRVQTIPSPLLKRALAVYSMGFENGEKALIKFLVKVVGEGTRRLAALQPGDQLDLIGPLGNGFNLESARNRINFLVVGGTGIASVYLLAEYLVRQGEVVHLVYGAAKADELIGLHDFERLEIPIFLATEDGSLGYHGLVTGGFRDYLRGYPPQNAQIFTCGPNPMMQAVCEIALKHDIPCQLSVESKMACGFGVCLGCTVKTRGSLRLACTHGPVFHAEDFVWEQERAPER
jgi:dihydroorotate dehydrogenase electron transfer subunit